MPRLVASALTVVIATLSLAAGAQQVLEPTSIALNQLDPSPAGDIFFGIPSPYAVGEIFEPRAKVMFEGSSDPLRLVQGDGEGNEVGAVVSSQLHMHIDVSAGILDRALVSVLLPVALRQTGDNPRAEGIDATSPTSAQLGDLRIGLRIRLFGEYDEPFQIGTGAYMWVPTGASDEVVGSYMSESAVRVTPYASLGGTFKLGTKWWWTATVGPEIRGGDNPSKIRYGAGFAAVFFDDLLTIGPEFFAATPVQESTEFQISGNETLEQTESTNAEILLGTNVRVWHFTAGAAGGAGLTKAIGTPKFRLMATIAYDPLPPKPDTTKVDTDGDDIVDSADHCPHTHGPRHNDPKKNGCPELDDDEDGIPNDKDACPDEYGTSSTDPGKHGCVSTTP